MGRQINLTNNELSLAEGGFGGGWNVLCAHEHTPPPRSLRSWFSWYFSQWFWIFAPFCCPTLLLGVASLYIGFLYLALLHINIMSIIVWHLKSDESTFSFVSIRGDPRGSLEFELAATVQGSKRTPPSFTQSCNFFCFLPVCLCDAKCHWEYPNMSASVWVGLYWIPWLWKKDLNEGSFIVQVCVLHTRAFSLQ